MKIKAPAPDAVKFKYPFNIDRLQKCRCYSDNTN